MTCQMCVELGRQRRVVKFFSAIGERTWRKAFYGISSDGQKSLQALKQQQLVWMDERFRSVNRQENGLVHFPGGAAWFSIDWCDTTKTMDALFTFFVLDMAKRCQFVWSDSGLFPGFPAGGFEQTFTRLRYSFGNAPRCFLVVIAGRMD